MEEKRRSRNGCLWALLMIQTLALVVVIGLALGLAGPGKTLSRPAVGKERGVDEYPDLEEVWSYGTGDAKVVVIPVRGMILLDQERDFFSTAAGSADLALMAIRRATQDPDVRGLILDIDSGGGGITASDIIYKALLDFKSSAEGRKVVALLGDVAASGAYYIALAADRIVAHPTTVTGSIGVLIQSLNVQGLGEKLGIKDVTIKSGDNKDMLNPFHELTPEQRVLLQDMVDELHGRFVTLVAEQRQLDVTEVRQLADGRIFTATKALEQRLVDRVGYWEDAMAETATLLGVDNVKVYRYKEAFSFLSLLRASQEWNPVSALMGRMNQTRVMYLWQL